MQLYTVVPGFRFQHQVAAIDANCFEL